MLANYLTPSELTQLRLKRIEFKAQRNETAKKAVSPYAQYANDPVGFCVNVLGESYTDDIKRVMESVRDNPVTIAESANSVGKTHGAARISTWWYKCREEAQVYTACAPPEDNLKRLLWGEIGSVVKKHGNVFADDTVNILSISRNPKEFIAGVTIPSAGTPAEREARFSGKHARNLLFILDEADAIPVEVFRGIESCLSGSNGRLLLMYNPRSNDGPVAELKARGVPVIKLTAFNHPNVITGNDIIPGAVTRNKTLHRINKWSVLAQGDIAGFGRFTVPDFLVGCESTNEETQEKWPPLPPGERIITDPQLSYMVLAEYPGQSIGVIYDVWLDDYDRAIKEGIQPLGNVQDSAEYIPGGGQVFWGIDDGYAGSVDPRTGYFTEDSHPRCIGFFQLRPNGDLVLFDEYCKVKEPRPEIQIQDALKRPYAHPEFIALGPGCVALGGLISDMGMYKKTCNANVEESIKIVREWMTSDENHHRRLLVHPRCKHFRFEVARYRRDDNGRILKAYDHMLDLVRYVIYTGRNGFV